jgi:hypothetical protein
MPNCKVCNQPIHPAYLPSSTCEDCAVNRWANRPGDELPAPASPFTSLSADVIATLKRRGVSDPESVWTETVKTAREKLPDWILKLALLTAGVDGIERAQSNNHSCGLRGVSRKRNRWQAKVNGKSIGCFDTPEAAYQARLSRLAGQQ